MTVATSFHLFILTGASRGMGHAMAGQLLQPGHTVLTLSRRIPGGLAAKAQAAGAELVQWSVDLADDHNQNHSASAHLHGWLDDIAPQRFASATLINNAGVIPPLMPLRDADSADLMQALRVGLQAPMLLTAAFLSGTRHWTGQRKVLNISSGLGRRAMASQSAYCAAKAGLDHFTRCLALDEAAQPNGAKVCALAPGVIDTDMQTHLRSADAAHFPDQAAFGQLKTNGQLAHPDDAARVVLAWLARPDFGDPPVADVRTPRA
ncbi:SDR family NAD(P)-dependent oxidoreductase [Ottowia sp.]|uniref:SDR family NAD(P)-dependent oxidoreductase n=1 Tax=Ottowia sp. TaxID=1898956 RepID=UPI003A887082